MRAALAGSTTVQFFNFIFHTLFVLHATPELGLSTGVLGWSLESVRPAGWSVPPSRAVRAPTGTGPGIGFAAFPIPLLPVPLRTDALVLSSSSSPNLARTWAR
ncbi:hypothetical protein [Streptomyces sp. NPDC127066]|uniref:hypothetical protein n=1 Tax=Streptomyces sp. NPDC127066 TaxID=3347125 RepID=UPI00365F93DF